MMYGFALGSAPLIVSSGETPSVIWSHSLVWPINTRGWRSVKAELLANSMSIYSAFIS